jgi:hypothetical protein
VELGKIIDDNSDEDDNINSISNNSQTTAAAKNGEALSKGGILEKASV